MNIHETASKREPAPLQPETASFVLAWGEMGAVWGINRSTAQVHALLLTSASPLGLDDIATALQISRGNASMCLKELRTWGVVHKQSRPGDRKDYFASDDDVWAMFANIARQRKRHEFDPALAAVRSLLASMEACQDGRGGQRAPEPDDRVCERLRQMDALLTGLDGLAAALLRQAGGPGLFDRLTAAVVGAVGRARRPHR